MKFCGFLGVNIKQDFGGFCLRNLLESLYGVHLYNELLSQADSFLPAVSMSSGVETL